MKRKNGAHVIIVASCGYWEKIMAVKVFFIAKMKDLNDEYKGISQRIRQLGEGHPDLLVSKAKRLVMLKSQSVLGVVVKTWQIGRVIQSM